MNNENTLVGKLTKFCNSVYGAAIIGFLVIFTAFINFIQFNQYPFFSMGILLNILVIVALSFCMALVYKFAPQSIKNFLIFLLGMFGLGLYSQSIWGYVLLLVLYIIVKNRLLGIYAVLSLVILVTSPVKYLFVQDAEIPLTEKRVGTQPFILHLVMDEHIGLKGLDSYIVDVKDAKTEIRDFYNKNGFNLYEGAYSKQSITVNSMPIILNFGDETFKNNGFMQEVSLGDNKYFNLLEEKGYEIKIFQSDFIDYCKHSSVIACETTLRSGPMPADIDQENLTIFEKTWVVGYPFVANSPLIRMLFFGLDNTVILLNEFGMDIDVVMAVGRGQLISPYGLSTFNQLNKAIEHAKPGQVYFTHAIFPHSPYIFDKNCKLKKYANWAGQLRPTGTREHREEANIVKFS